MKKTLSHHLSNLAFIGLGIISAGFGIKGFLVPNGFIDGGVTGVSMLAAKLLGFPLYILIPVVNAPFVITGFFHIGKAFAARSIAAIIGLALCLLFMHPPDATHDPILCAIFGGFFLGAGIGLAIRGGAVLDGTEIAALLISKVSDYFRVGDVILIFNILIFLSAAVFLGIEAAMYSALTYLSAAKTVNFLLHGIEEYTSVTIISTQPDTIRERIIHELKRSVTRYKGAGGASGSELDILVCIVTRLEIGGIKDVVRDVDPAAFIVTHALSDVEGGVVKKPAYH